MASLTDRLHAERQFIEAHGLETTTRVFAAVVVGEGYLMPLGALTVDEAEGTVELVVVQDHHQRRGLATELLAIARQVTGLPLDKDTGERSPAGQAWAESVGLERGEHETDTPEREGIAQGARLMTAISFGDASKYEALA